MRFSGRIYTSGSAKNKITKGLNSIKRKSGSVYKFVGSSIINLAKLWNGTQDGYPEALLAMS